MCCLGSAVLVKDLQQLGPGGMEQVCRRNIRGQVYEGTICIHDMIERQFKGTPGAAALDKWSLRVTTQLTREGVKPGVFVGIFMSKSMSVLVSMVAVMRAGGAFVLLPPSLPSFRLKVMCRKTPVGLVLTVKSLLREASQLGPRVEIVGNNEKNSKTESWTLPTMQPSDPLYAIYTSGSTGEPKGVVVDRGSFGTGVCQFVNKLGLAPGVRVFQSVSYAFVVSISEQLMALASGACICVPSEEELQNNLEAATCRLNATWGTMTPSVARTLDPTSLAVTQSDLEQWGKHVRLYSWYGQAETASSFLIKKLLGSPDEDYGLGSITTGATALAREYTNSAEEGARAFIQTPDWLRKLRPHGHRARCLLTGDIVRYSDIDGTIRLVGRKGTGVKIRGQRVELGEIEFQLRRHFSAAIHVMVEAVRPARSVAGQTVLVGFVAGSTGDIQMNARCAIAELRQSLPSFMIPSVIVPLAVVPTTATGKVYRKALREKMESLTVAEILAYNQQKRGLYRAPVNNREQLLQSIIEELLHLSPSSLSLDDSFFEAGGDSLSARQVVAKARSHGMTLTVASIFEASKVSDLALRLGQVNVANVELQNEDPLEVLRQNFLQTVPAFLRNSIEDVYPAHDSCSRAVHEHRVDYHIFTVKGPLDREKLCNACETFIRATPVMRSVFIPFQEQLLQVTLRSILTPYQELVMPDDDNAVSWTGAFSAQDQKIQHSFEQPVIRFFLMCKSTEEHIFVFRMPHALYDGGCLQQIGKMLSAAYNGVPLPISPTFAEYTRAAARLRTHKALEYWTRLISGSEIARLPRGAAGDQTMAIYPGEFTHHSPPPGITMATAIKAAWAWVLHQETGKSDILFGQVGSTRGIDLAGAPDVIGCCMNTTPVRVQFNKLKGKTAKDLFNMIHHQQVQGHRYETINWSEVIAHGTTWPKDTDFDSVVLHENFGGLPTLQLGEAVGEMSSPVFDSPPVKQHALLTWPVRNTFSAASLVCRDTSRTPNLPALISPAFVRI
ncbi:hypothetical protein BDV12DRAFT_210089 [Aspergillus spectabilis]